ncbi:MAG: peptidase [Microbacterium sp. SCN 70-200]|uniref:Trp biosynthesis-associated membrane protein n=1 Tax=unclassified Microbacterium TaxID=2609290 RepID=UPI00086EE993|nr:MULTISPECIES: Trp biosynthesis-associated membrane protein [unclassified Microbacterium]MBN9214300.1 Trp biosynthesis-associated membrane protein [Microbacterium sp.]ODT40946.1 MAG: peptidase [Microbacterium sp. SCN 70-200]OJV83883.1 MAG: peptidase [Microbacterium sp. 70-16]
MIARARTISVVAIILGGTIAIIASTQTWLEVTLRVGATTSLPVPGAAAFPLLAPLSLAALALGLALSIVGRVLRYVFGVIAAAIGVGLLIGSGRIGIEQPLDAVAAAVTEATGLSGASAIADLVASLAVTAWPFAAAAAGVLVLVGGLLTVLTAHRWRAGGRRYRRDAAVTDAPSGSRPYDAIDSWDDLSHGQDPTDR